MKKKTSVTLEANLLSELDSWARREKQNRSEFIESAVAAYCRQLERELIDEKDSRLIEKHLDSLNDEAADVLEYQGT